MEESNELPAVEQLTEYLTTEAYERALVGLEQYESAAIEERKDALQALRRLAVDQPTAFSSVLSGFVPFLTDTERSTGVPPMWRAVLTANAI